VTFYVLFRNRSAVAETDVADGLPLAEDEKA